MLQQSVVPAPNHQPGTMQHSSSEDHLASIVGLEEHLTVRSQGCASRLDLWFALKRSTVGTAWDQAFVTESSGKSLGQSLHGLEVYPFTPAHGWIVARGVNERLITRQATEAMIRTIVDRVNAVCLADQPSPSPAVERAPAPTMRNVLTDARIALRAIAAGSRAERRVDATSNP